MSLLQIIGAILMAISSFGIFRQDDYSFLAVLVLIGGAGMVMYG